MNADNFDLLTERVLSAVLEVSNTLGAGLLEMVYEWALLTELQFAASGPVLQLHVQ